MEIEITDREWKKLLFNVMKLDTKADLFKVWPSLGSVPQYSGVSVPGISKSVVLRYVFLFYDMNTPLSKYESIGKRKSVAARYAGMPEGASGFEQSLIAEIFLCKNKTVRDAILTFCKQQKSFIWETFTAIQDLHYRNLEDARSGEKKINSSDLIKEAESLQDLRSKIVSGDDSPELDTHLHSYTLLELGIKPEEVAIILASGGRI